LDLLGKFSLLLLGFVRFDSKDHLEERVGRPIAILAKRFKLGMDSNKL
jgi:hypothetical protein